MRNNGCLDRTDTDREQYYYRRGGCRGEVTRVTSHPPTPGAAAYFMLLLCVRRNSQTHKFHSPVSRDPPQCSLASIARVPEVTASKKILDPPMDRAALGRSGAGVYIASTRGGATPVSRTALISSSGRRSVGVLSSVATS